MENNHTGRNILLVFVAILLLAGTFSGGILVGWMLPGQTPLEDISASTAPTATVDEEMTLDVL
ncbi:MAG: hypothetical protein Q8R87_08810, partial [Anaerolineaceae bacterium]|nr:hypothetical protein [Anaerolineaceae bacterium]